jgi:hypothetical protein
MSYKVEILAYNEDRWVSNSLRFASEDAAREYGANLAMRWTMVKDWRVAVSDDPANRIAEGQEIK